MTQAFQKAIGLLKAKQGSLFEKPKGGILSKAKQGGLFDKPPRKHIGTTSSGKQVYAQKHTYQSFMEHHKDWTPPDHAAAASFHATEMYPTRRTFYDQSLADQSLADRMSYMEKRHDWHLNMATVHHAAEELKQGGHPQLHKLIKKTLAKTGNISFPHYGSSD